MNLLNASPMLSHILRDADKANNVGYLDAGVGVSLGLACSHLVSWRRLDSICPPVRFHSDATLVSLQFRFVCTSKSRPSHCDFTPIPLQDHFVCTSMSL